MELAKTSKGSRSRLKVDIYRENEKLESLALNANNEGAYRFPSAHTSDVLNHLSLEGRKGVWSIVSDVPFRVNNQSKSLLKMNLVPMESQYLIEVEGAKAVIFTQWDSNDDVQYSRFQFKKVGTITIGRDYQNDIQIINHRASRQHAKISFDGRQFYIKDLRSTNGTFVNGWRVDSSSLKCGDFLCFGGIEMVVGIGFLLINQGSRQEPDVLIKSELLQIWKPNNFNFEGQNRSNGYEEVFINRYPRSRTSLKDREIRIEAPPFSMNSKQMPLMLRMGSSLVMGGSAALMGNFTMLISSVLFPFLTSKYTEKEKKEYEQNRIQKYTAYLNKKEQEIYLEIEHERKILNANYPELNEVLNYSHRIDKIWSHKENDDDFLQLRIGTGDVPMKADLQVPQESFALEEDILLTRMMKIGNQQFMVPDAPMLIDILKDNIISVGGDEKGRWNMFLLLLARISLLFSYDEVKLVLVLNESTLNQFPFVRYLPHCFNNDFTERTIATETGQTLQISKKLSEIFAERLKNVSWKENTDRTEHYIIISDSKSNLDKIEILKKVMPLKKELGFSVITIFDQVLKDTKIKIDLKSSTEGVISYLEDLDKTDEAFKVDVFDPNSIQSSIRQMFQYRLNSVTQQFTLPKSLDFLSMFNVTDIRYLNPLNRWKESNPIRSLATPIGVNVDGSLFTLDLHQNYQGPHGLVAGTTGSGKSEFLISYILSMAVNYSPYEVSFVLIDYKGGGLAGAFSNPEKGVLLPHLVGTMTNLDGATINRSIQSIESELKRRQIIFNEAKKKLDEGTMDIYLYQKLYRENKVKEPVPHLFIISDEFAELKQQEPEFMDKLISTARIGRSLGVHLILATQKPSGVVNDQILSNVKFKVCLKVQEAADSNDMLKRPDAASLKEAGRFYLQVGYDEYFALGQSGWSGAQYCPGEKEDKSEGNTVEFIDNTGTVVHTGRLQTVKKTEGASQLVALVKELSSIAQEQHLELSPLWLPSLPLTLDADEENQKVLSEEDQKEMKLCLGFADDPGRQKQYSYIVSLRKMKNMLITGDMGSGRSSLLQTIILKACEHFSPEQLNIYGIDLSGRGFNLFKSLPHCGTILDESDIDDYQSFFDLMDSIVEQRKALFEKAGVDDYSGYCDLHSLPLVLVLLDDFAEIKNSKAGEMIHVNFQDYLKKSTRYGLCYIVTAGQTTDLMSRAKNEFFELIALQHQEPYKYNDTLNMRVSGPITATPGRGYCIIREEAFECQFARIRNDLRGFERNNYLRERIEQIGEKYPGKYFLAKIPKIPQEETFKEFSEQFPKDRLPLGYHLVDAKPISIPYKQFSMMTLYFGGEVATELICTNFLESLSEQNGQIILMSKEDSEFCSSFIKSHGEQDIYKFQTTTASLDSLWKQLMPEMLRRRAMHERYCEEMGMERFDNESDRSFSYMRENTRPLFIFFEDYSEFCSNASEATIKFFTAFYSRIRWWNIYVFVCLYPSTVNQSVFSKGYKIFNPDKLVMLFGGEFGKQPLISVSGEAAKITKDEPPNICYMQYQGEPHFLYIPCGNLKKPVVADEDKSIFE